MIVPRSGTIRTAVDLPAVSAVQAVILSQLARVCNGLRRRLRLVASTAAFAVREALCVCALVSCGPRMWRWRSRR